MTDYLTKEAADRIDAYYRWVAETKIDIHGGGGFICEEADLHPSLFPHQRDTVRWMLARGKALNASSFGLGKTRIACECLRQIHNRTGAKTLIVAPLGVRHQFTVKDGPAMGMKIQYVRTDAEALAADTPYLITNYERVREGDISAAFLAEHIEAISLDEGSVLRSLGSDTQQTFENVCRPIPYRFVCTATPSPNDWKELIYYSQFLGVMDAGQALTRWFKRDSQHAGHLTVHPHLEREFWLWVASWALFVQKPSDLGYSDEGYTMPPITVHWHRIAADHTKAWDISDKYGNVMLFKDSAASIQASIKEKRDSLQDRVDKTAEIIAADSPTKHWLVWHHLEDERRAMTKAIPDAVDVFGSQDLDVREQRIVDFSDGKYRILATKPEIAGSGCNFQEHCYANIFTGVRYQFEEFIQAIHRTQRFGQTKPVEVHIIHTDAEDQIVEVMKTKWAKHNQLVDNMTHILREFGLTNEALSMNLKRTLGLPRQETSGKWFTAINNDSIVEMERWADNSVDLIHTSIPFSKHYEYSPSKNDMGHNPSNEAFWQQMDFLIPHLLRTLKPGRMAVIHVKDLLEYAHNSGLGVMAVYPFSDDCVAAFRKHGFIFCGRVTVNTDVVRENNSTYRLSWSEMVKDGTKMGAGLPEYVLYFRKKQSDTQRSYADEPVVHTKDEYPVSRWQVDAHAYWRSSGNRLLRPDEIEAAKQEWTPEQLTQTDAGRIYRWYKLFSAKNLYDYQAHLDMVAALDDAGALPKTYGLMLPHAPDGGQDYVWSDVVSMQTLNSSQFRKGEENHVCPLPFDIVERVIERFSNPDEVVLDPFGGLFTVPYIAIKMGRRGVGIELNPVYYEAGVQYCKEAELNRGAPTLFELIDAEAAAIMPTMVDAA
ncbi:MAG: DNA methylase N-4 [Rhizobiales bacterium]|nr:DNA methylase N-4 [Hyphomicrobiales bacterium]